MIDIYQIGYMEDGTFVDERKLLETIPAKNEKGITLMTPKVDAKTGNAESMSFSIQPDSAAFDSFAQMRSFIEVNYDGDNIFYGRVLTIEDGFYGEQKIRCEGPISFLNDSYYPASKESERPTISVLEYLTQLIDNHNSQVNDPHRTFYLGEVPGKYSVTVSEEQKIKGEDRAYGTTSWTSTKSALEDLRSHFGGMLRVRYENGKLYLDWLQHYYRSGVNSQTVEVAKNVISLSSITEVSNIFTAVIPVGKKSTKNETDQRIYISGYRTDIHGDNNYLRADQICPAFYTEEELNSGYHRAVDYSQSVSKYGLIFKVVDIQEADTQEKLLSKAAEWIKDNYQGGIDSFTVSAVDLHQLGYDTDKLMTGDRVKVKYRRGKPGADGKGQAEERTLTCTAVTYDLHNPENNQYTFGIPANSLSKMYGTKNSKSVSSSSSTPKYTWEPEDTEIDPYKRWWNEAYKWLGNHQVWFNSNGKSQGGPNPGGAKMNYFVRPSAEMDEEGNAKKVVWDPWVERMEHGYPIWRRDAQGRPLGSFLTVKASDYNRNWLINHRIIQYVRDEYNYDLETGGTNKLPNYVVDENGNLSLLTEKTNELYENMTSMIPTLNFDSVEGILEYLNENGTFPIETIQNGITSFMGSDGKTLISQLADGVFSFLGSDGETIVSKFEDGIYKYFWTNPDTGEVEETNIRDLQINAYNDSKKVGWVVTEDEQGDMSFTNPGEISMAVENHIGGPIVVTRIIGEEMYLGNKSTQKITMTSVNHMDAVCGDVEYEEDPETHEVTMKIKSAGGLRVQKKDSGGHTVTVGLYDGDNLTGGVMVDKINENTTVVKIKGDRIDMDASQVRFGDASTVAEKFGLTDDELDELEGIVAKKATIVELNAAKARINQLELDDLIMNGSITMVGGDIFTTGNINAGLNQQNYIRGKTLRLIGGSSSQGAQEAILSYGDVDSMIIKAVVENNTLKMWKHGDSIAGDPSITFSKATSLSGAWSGSDYYVTASPQGNTFKVPMPMRLMGGSPPTASFSAEIVDGGIAKKSIYGSVGISGSGSSAYANVYDSGSSIVARVSVGSIYSGGWNDGWDNAAGLVVMPSAGTETTFTVKIPRKYQPEQGGPIVREQVTKTFTLAKGNPGTDAKVGVSLAGVIGSVAQIDVGDIYTAGYEDGLPGGIGIGSLSNAGQTIPSGATLISDLSTASLWSNWSDYGYLTFNVSVHGKSKKYYFPYDNRKMVSGGNPAYAEGYSAGNTDGFNSGYNIGYPKGWDYGLSQRIRTTRNAESSELTIKTLDFGQRWTIVDTYTASDGTTSDVVYTVASKSNPYPTTKTLYCSGATFSQSQWVYTFTYTNSTSGLFKSGSSYKFHHNSGYT